MITDTIQSNRLIYYKLAPDYFDLQLDERIEPETLVGYDFLFTPAGLRVLFRYDIRLSIHRKRWSAGCGSAPRELS